MTVTFWLELITPAAVAVKLALEAVATTMIETGIVTRLFDRERVTIAPPAGAAFESVTVHVVFCNTVSEVAVQSTEETVTGLTRESGVVEEEPL